MIRITLLATVIVALAGCNAARNVASSVTNIGGNRGPNSVTINDTRFRTRLALSGDEKREMAITVRPVAVDPEAAQEAGRHRATAYCLQTFGSSQTDWLVGPDVPVDQVEISDGTITLQGRCAAR
ncbi:MAG: hypothetical protein AAGG54_12775 [Pseudomonadota bacterium]